jgi:hypothetical protein
MLKVHRFEAASNKNLCSLSRGLRVKWLLVLPIFGRRRLLFACTTMLVGHNKRTLHLTSAVFITCYLTSYSLLAIRKCTLLSLFPSTHSLTNSTHLPRGMRTLTLQPRIHNLLISFITLQTGATRHVRCHETAREPRTTRKS